MDKETLFETVKPSKAVVSMAIPTILAMMVKVVYNLTDTVFVSLMKSETALAAVGVSMPLIMMVGSIETILSVGSSILAGRQLGAKNKEGANTTISSIYAVSIALGVIFCVGGFTFMEPMLRAFGASETVMPQAKQYATWMFVMFLASIPTQCLNMAARAESSAKISSMAVIVGVLLNVVLDPIFMFNWGLGMGVEGAALATCISQFVTAAILFWFYFSGRSIIKIRLKNMELKWKLFKTVTATGVPTATTMFFAAMSLALINVAAATLPDNDFIIAANSVVQKLVLIGYQTIIGFITGYQPVAAYYFGAKNSVQFREAQKFALKTAILLGLVEAVIFAVLSKYFIMLFNQNPSVVDYGSKLLISQTILLPVFALVFLSTINFQVIGSVKYGVFLSIIRQGLFFVPAIIVAVYLFGVLGLYLAQPIADVSTLVVCVFSYSVMNRTMLKKIYNDSQSE